MRNFVSFCFCWCIAFSINAQNNSFHCSQANTILKMFDKYHYQDMPIDEKVSADIYDDFLSSLDDEALYFSQTDFKYLLPYRTAIQKDITSNTCKLLEYTTFLFKRKLQFADSVINVISKNPVDLTKNDTYTFSDDFKKNVATTDAQLVDKWLKIYKYTMLSYIFNHDLKNKTTKENLAQEPDIRAKAAIILHRRIKYYLQYPEGIDNYVTDAFLNAIALRYDPHSLFLSQKNMQAFRESLSKDQFAYGFSSEESSNGETKITALVPGGSAWKSNQLNVGDILQRVKFENGSPIDISYMSDGELNALFKNASAKSVELTVKKSNGQTQVVKLIKSKVKNDDNIVKGYILNGKKKIGYILLPSFYSNFNGRAAAGCANDVAKEIIRLQQEKIEGLILDIRDNGGGSMYEALDLAGIFIDEGPLGLIKDNQQKISVLKDMNRGAAYSGPLVVMINNQSASASELLSGVLQDYNRAVIVGNTTFGKATAQTTFPMDINFTPNPRTDPSATFCNQGYTNITIEKFYRVSSVSHQNVGIHPDIEIPDLYNMDKETEATQKYALQSDTAGKKLTFAALAPLPISSLKSKSVARIQSNPRFLQLKTINDSIRLMEKEENSTSLNIETYKNDKTKFTSLKDKVKTLYQTPVSLFNVTNHKDDLDLFKFDADEKAVNEQNVKNIQNDFLLEEAFSIISDLISNK